MTRPTAVTALRDELCDAWALIADPEHWCQGASARDAAGTPVSPSSPFAVCWCALGPPRLTSACIVSLDNAAEGLYGNPWVSSVNDEIGHAAIERVYALAVAMEAQP